MTDVLPPAPPDHTDTRGPEDITDWSDVLADSDACTDAIRPVRRGESGDCGGE